MKLLGCVMIALASLLGGVLYTRGIKQRQEELASACAMLELMRGELETRLTPLPELAAELAGRVGGAGEAFLLCLAMKLKEFGKRNFAELWAESVDGVFCASDAETRNRLIQLGPVLGRYDIGSQLSALDSCADALRRRYLQLSGDMPQLLRLGMGLCMSAGALIVILLI